MAALTVSQLLAQLAALVERGQGDAPVVIRYDSGKATIGASPVTGITGAMAGFDWDSGKVFLHTDHRVGLAGPELDALRKEHTKALGYLWKLSRLVAEDIPESEMLAKVKAELSIAIPPRRVLAGAGE